MIFLFLDFLWLICYSDWFRGFSGGGVQKSYSCLLSHPLITPLIFCGYYFGGEIKIKWREGWIFLQLCSNFRSLTQFKVQLENSNIENQNLAILELCLRGAILGGKKGVVIIRRGCIKGWKGSCFGKILRWTQRMGNC